MPDLPTLTVTDAQAQRIQNAFGGVAAYREWLRAQIKQHVLLSEQEAMKAKVEQELSGI